MSYEANTDLEAGSAPTAPHSAFGVLVDSLNGLGSLVIASVMVLMCADVVLRNLFNQPIDGVAELVATSIIIIVFLQLPATLRHGRMSRADLFIDPFVARRPRAGKRLRALFSLAGVFACGDRQRACQKDDPFRHKILLIIERTERKVISLQDIACCE